jgi:hypothetical protein
LANSLSSLLIKNQKKQIFVAESKQKLYKLLLRPYTVKVSPVKDCLLEDLILAGDADYNEKLLSLEKEIELLADDSSPYYLILQTTFKDIPPQIRSGLKLLNGAAIHINHVLHADEIKSELNVLESVSYSN